MHRIGWGVINNLVQSISKLSVLVAWERTVNPHLVTWGCFRPHAQYFIVISSTDGIGLVIIQDIVENLANNLMICQHKYIALCKSLKIKINQNYLVYFELTRPNNLEFECNKIWLMHANLHLQCKFMKIYSCFYHITYLSAPFSDNYINGHCVSYAQSNGGQPDFNKNN